MEIQQLLAFAVAKQASDVHLSSGMPPLLRIDGQMQRLDLEPMAEPVVAQLLATIMTDQHRGQLEAVGSVDFALDIEALSRFRVNVFKQQHGLAAVFRLIKSQVPTLEQLAAPDIFKTIAALKQGLVLVTGATGSGKSTTLAALLDYKNTTENGHILTLEDPIEYIHPSRGCLINQREIGRDVTDFNAALLAALREDPDTILVGELRDVQTIRLALTAAETGHLVLATLHTASAARTVDRIIDVFPGNEKDMIRGLLSQSLAAVISQQLVPRKAGGRQAVHEILISTPAVRNLIREGKTAQIDSVIQSGAQQGMQSSEQALQKLYKAGVI